MKHSTCLSKPSFSDAKIPKNVTQDFVGGDFAEDGAEGVEGLADVLGYKVGRD